MESVRTDSGPFSVIDGAIGTLGDRQLSQLEALLRSRAGKCVVVLIHHHLGCPRKILRENPLSKVELRVLQLNGANRVCDLLAEHKPAVVLHGHKHLDYRATYKCAMIQSAASVAYGDRLGGENCHVYDIEANGRVSLVASTHIAVS